jgi:ParB-like nuclease domain
MATVQHVNISMLLITRPSQDIDWDKVTTITRSIEANGWNDNSVLNVQLETSTGHYFVSNGNHRAYAARRTGMQTVPVQVIGESEVIRRETFGRP